MATIRQTLTAAITAQVNNPQVIQPIPVPNINLGGAAPANSIFVPFRKKNGAYDRDSLITITSLLNQWNIYTSDHTPNECGIFSGYGAGNAPINIAPYIFLATFNNDYQYAINFLSSIVADIQIAAFNGGSNCQNPAGVAFNTNILGIINLFINAITMIHATQPAAPPLAAHPQLDPTLPAGASILGHGWSHILNNIAEQFPIVRKQAQPNEIYGLAPGPPPPPPPPAIPPRPIPNAGLADCIPPADLIRYSFGLLWQIKKVLGEGGWSDTHAQITFGGGKKKSSRFTHRKKQYSQRRYKK
jgi:hypothetical protein